MPNRLRAWPAVIVLALALGSAAGAAPAPPPDVVRGKTAEVFDRPEFRPDAPRGNSWLLRQLKAFFDWLGGLHETAPHLFWIVLVACVVTLLAMIALIVWQVRSVFVRGGAYARGGRGPTAQDGERVRLSAGCRAEAARKAEAGEYTEAVRFLFLSLVYRFDERGRVSFHKAYTNREYLELLSDRRNVHDTLMVMVDTLDDHWYGQRPCGLSQYSTCLAAYERLAATA